MRCATAATGWRARASRWTPAKIRAALARDVREHVSRRSRRSGRSRPPTARLLARPNPAHGTERGAARGSADGRAGAARTHLARASRGRDLPVAQLDVPRGPAGPERPGPRHRRVRGARAARARRRARRAQVAERSPHRRQEARGRPHRAARRVPGAGLRGHRHRHQRRARGGGARADRAGGHRGHRPRERRAHRGVAQCHRRGPRERLRARAASSSPATASNPSSPSGARRMRCAAAR